MTLLIYVLAVPSGAGSSAGRREGGLSWKAGRDSFMEETACVAWLQMGADVTYAGQVRMAATLNEHL